MPLLRKYVPVEKVRPFDLGLKLDAWCFDMVTLGAVVVLRSHNNMNLHLPTTPQELAWTRNCDDMDNLQAKFGQLQQRWEMTEANPWLFFEALRAQLLGHEHG